MLMFAKSQRHSTLISADGSRWPSLLWESFDENEFGRDATRCVALRRNNLFDDFSVWWLQQVRPTAAVLSPALSQTILPPTATPRFAFNKWPNHSARGRDLSKNRNFSPRCRLASHRSIYRNKIERRWRWWHVARVAWGVINVAVEIAILYSLSLQ